MIAQVFAPRFIVFYVFVLAAVFVHYRGRVRHRRDEGLKLFDEGYIRAAASYNDVGFNSFFRTGWKRFYLKWYDQPLASAHALCPKTVALVQSIPTIHGAMFAVLPPGGRLVRHRDPYAGSLRYHLGLVTPNAETCRIFVDGDPYFWKDGEDVLFDETFIHYAENESEPVGVLNKVFGYVYQVRLVGKRLKARSRLAYYTVKYVLFGAPLYWIFLS